MFTEEQEPVRYSSSAHPSVIHLTDTQLDNVLDVEMLRMMSEDTGSGELSTLCIFMSSPAVLCLVLAYNLIGMLPFLE